MNQFLCLKSYLQNFHITLKPQPRIEPTPESDVVINSGDTWEVNCTGEAPLEWDYSNR